jgi:hypothetical protein
MTNPSISRFRAATSLLRLVASATLALAPLLAVPSAQAAVVDCSSPLDIHLSYQVNHNLGQQITDVITFNNYATCTGTGSWWPSTVGSAGGLVTDPFTKSSSNRPTQALLLGLTQDLPGDAPGQQHVVMMVDSAAAAAAQNIAWGTTFLSTLEEDVIADLVLTMRTDRATLVDGSAEAIAWDAALTDLYTFVTGDAAGMFFNMPGVVPGSTTSSDFSVMAWSDGSIVGSGTAFLSTDLAASVPEPSSLALVLLPLMFAASARQRRRQGR